MTSNPPARISVIMPAYNEAATIGTIIAQVLAVPHDVRLIVVDDGSTDHTRAIALHAAQEHPNRVQVLAHKTNTGKGSAIRTALQHADGDIVIIQDADLEYDPADYTRLIAAFADPGVGAVFGSRNLSGNRTGFFIHKAGVACVTMLANVLYGARLTDIATCYKAFRGSVIRSADMRHNGFGFDAEVTAHVLRNKQVIVEVPIRYMPRSYAEGKKIRMRDGLWWIWILIRSRMAQ